MTIENDDGLALRAATAEGDVPRVTVPLLAFIAGAAVATIYFDQPTVTLMQASLGSGAANIPTITFAGYAAGVLLLVPLGDRFRRRILIALHLAGLAVALGVAALAPTLTVLAVASFAIGMFATAAQQAVPFAAQIAPPGGHGRTVGKVMTGLLLGILLARTFSGFIGEYYGWRVVYAVSAFAIALVAALTLPLLPARPSETSMSYGALLRSLALLLRRHPALRQVVLLQACLFAAFNVFWVSLVFHLATPAFGLGPNAAGLFGLVGAGGALLAPVAGRYADRYGSAWIAFGATILAALAFVAFGTWGAVSLVGIGLGVMLLDIGINSALIANQTLIYGLDPQARGRLNTIFLSGVFIGGTLGSIAATEAWQHGGWMPVCVVGGVAALASVGVAALGLRRSS